MVLIERKRNRISCSETESGQEKKKKKSVQWRQGALLTQVKYFEVDEEIIKPHKANAREFERDECKNAKQRARDELVPMIPWKPLKSNLD